MGEGVDGWVIVRVSLVALGSVGDVAPVLTIGAALAARGHGVRVVALEQYADLVGAAGLTLEPIAATEASIWPDRPVLRAAALAQPGFMYAAMRASFRRLAPRTNEALLRAAADADVLVSGLATRGACQVAAGALGVRHLSVLYAPLLPARRAASTALGFGGAGPLVTHATSSLMWRLTGGLGAAHAAEMAARLGRSASGLPAPPTLLATSPVVSPPAAQWPRGVEQVGWVPSTQGRADIPPALARFLDRGEPPVLMTFGSCPVVSPRRDRRLFLRAARDAGVRVIVAGTPDGAGSDGGVLVTGPVDFAQLLPGLAAVVHHGGAGTTYTALAAGVPAVVVPHLGDQGYYAARVAALGVGPRGVPRSLLTAPHLARLVRAALAPDVALRARQVAGELADTVGTHRIVERIEASAAAA